MKVNDTFDFGLKKESIAKLDVVSVETNQFHILHQNLPYKAEIVSSNFNQKKDTIKVNNSAYQVAISNPLDILIKEMGF